MPTGFGTRPAAVHAAHAGDDRRRRFSRRPARFSGSAAALTRRWAFSGVGTTTGSAAVNIIELSPVQAGTQVAYRCRRG